jgi:hypothetical protein
MNCGTYAVHIIQPVLSYGGCTRAQVRSTNPSSEECSVELFTRSDLLQITQAPFWGRNLRYSEVTTCATQQTEQFPTHIIEVHGSSQGHSSALNRSSRWDCNAIYSRAAFCFTLLSAYGSATLVYLGRSFNFLIPTQ